MIFAEIEIGNAEKHRVRYERDVFSGADKVFVDGVLLKERKFSYGTKFLFEVGAQEKHQVFIRFGLKQWGLLQPRFEVDGVEHPVAAGNPIPKGTWKFFVGCLAVPILSAGGAVPALIGACGAMGCISVLQSPKYSDPQKRFYCTLITLGTWGVFILFVLSLSAS